ncbi:hypothetical protein LF1_21690 [Rubripirellula obstinata]|uniref:VanZ like family protein n=1 Tax=Rubripirellula obstinata TaxID=406547 RepID=A0A5B1CJY2_9BACT|nr:hypothetical protein [Rubripirellula obstinata]KAA1259634.1 hypothetical protein LF1_21690 [Rubripirellula obstinata]
MPSLETENPPEPLGRSKVRPILGLAALLLLSVVGLMIPLPDGGRILPRVGDMAHAPLFAGITVGLIMVWNYLRPPIAWNQFLVRLCFASAIAFAFGGLTEVAQGLTGRTASLHDLAADSWGIVAACCFLIASGSGGFVPLKKWSVVLLLLAAGSIILSWLAPLATINDALAMKKEFPLLASFERKAELERWHFANCYARRVHRDATNKNFSATDGDWALEVSYQSGTQTSATLYEMQNNWSDRDGIVIDAFALNDPTLLSGTIKVAVQIIDAHHGEKFQDVCRKVFLLELGKQTELRIPREQWITTLGRPLDLTAIRFLDLQLASRPANAKVRFDNVRLYSNRGEKSDRLTARVAR